jgi:hypothetical protein
LVVAGLMPRARRTPSHGESHYAQVIPYRRIGASRRLELKQSKNYASDTAYAAYSRRVPILLPYPLKIRSIPLWSLQLVAAMATVAGLASPRSKRSAAILRWMIYSSTHDEVAISCGTRRLHDEFCSKRDALRRTI